MIFFRDKTEALVTDSATQGLYLLFKELENSTVILHPNTCLQVYMAAIYANKKVAFVDIDPITCNYRKESLESEIIKSLEQKENPIVLIVHLLGITCSLEIIDLCKKYKSIIIEDCAQSLFSYYSDETPVGSKGDYSVF